ncbi:hypothetical protein [Halogeometricum limi]|uniref:Uncharacterized protein n=1 Tax=Halogeometricum limi TaxID=555875 RepID=A0A1I6GI88_9EURY|nr:hypothetical protein [Halogeometricum limi]SFR41894.1 hypothetical protein SAMN04488124_1083 [Halogeometricum limi]
MASHRCSFCGSAVPETRYCVNCNTNVGAVDVPRRNPSLTAHLSEVTADADHESVTFDALRSRHDQYDRPLGGYLFADERPRRVLDVDGVTLEDVRGETWTVRPGFRRRGHAILTDDRLLLVTPADPGDQLVAVPLDDVVAVETESTWLRERLTFERADGWTTTVSLAGVSADELDAVAADVRERVRATDSAASRAAAFERDVDAAVADADDAETALRAVADLFAERDETAVFDHVVREASSADDLLSGLSNTTTRPSLPTPADGPSEAGDAGDAEGADATPVNGGDGGGASSLPTAGRPSIEPVRQRVSRTLRDGDPKEAGKWAIGAGIAGFSVAVSLPFSTAAGLGAIALGGAATGAYASANPESAAARIDPIELALGAKTRERQWKRGGGPGGAAVGSVLGAAEHVVDRTDDTAYAHWLANADPELALRGATLGAEAAKKSPNADDPTTAALVGGGLGLAYGYTDLDYESDELRELLDEDVRRRLSAEGEAGEVTGDGETVAVEGGDRDVEHADASGDPDTDDDVDVVDAEWDDESAE